MLPIWYCVTTGSEGHDNTGEVGTIEVVMGEPVGTVTGSGGTVGMYSETLD